MGNILVIVINVENNQESYYKYIDLFMECQKRDIGGIIKCKSVERLYTYVESELVYQKQDLQRLSNVIEEMIEAQMLEDMDALNKGESAVDGIILYFRLKMRSDSDVTNLQYYFLIKQCIEAENQYSVLPVYCQLLIDDNSMIEMRYKISHFLVFESKKGSPVFLKNNNQGSVRDYGYVVNLPGTRGNSKYQITSLEKFYPLLEVNEDTYNMLSSTVSSALKACSESTERFPERLHKNYMDRRMTPQDILLDMCIYYFTEGGIQKGKEQRSSFFYSDEFLEAIKGMNLLSFLIMCSFEYYLFQSYKENEQEGVELSINDLQKKISMFSGLASGLLQIIENIIAHTKYRSGYFSFRIHNRNSEYLEKNYASYLNEMKQKLPCDMYLEVKVCDFSLEEREGGYSSTIAGCFMENLAKRAGKDEPEMSEFYEKFKGIAVKDFFQREQESGDYEDIWRAYYSRRKNWLHHYGLKLYARIVNKAYGFFEVNSQNGLTHISKEQHYATIWNENSASIYLPGTQYNVILPYLTDSSEQEHIGVDSDINYDAMLQKLLQSKIQANEKSLYEMLQNIMEKIGNAKNITADGFCNLQSKKEKYMEEAEKEIRKAYQAMDSTLDIIRVLILDTGELCNSFLQEVAAKAVWGHICCEDADGEFYCALTNCSYELIQFLVNTIAVYFGLNSHLTIKRKFQLYICNNKNGEDFLISGANLAEIRSRAYKFAASRGTFPSILTDLFLELGRERECIEPNCGQLEVIPFDVLIKEGKEIRFTQLVKWVMKKEIYYPDYGCKLPSVHIRLGSKIHIHNFYEAEILFQDSYFSKRMAYFVSSDILTRMDGIEACPKRLILVGYENYSEMFLYDTHKLLEIEIKRRKMPCLLEKYTICMDVNGVLEFDGLDKVDSYEDTEFVIIVSLNSTLTTHNKIRAALERKTGLSIGSSRIFANYAVILFRDDYGNEKLLFDSQAQPKNIMTKLENKFWHTIDNEAKVVKSRFVEEEIRYFISEIAIWEEPLLCPMCFPSENVLQEKALINTNKISIIPSLQYGLIRKGANTIWIDTMSVQKKRSRESERIAEWDAEDRTNEIKIRQLALNVMYGHIKRNDNHFLFYFDTKKLLEDCKTDIQIWLKETVNKQVKRANNDAGDCFGIYNILVTPVHESNTGFIELLNDCVFNNTAYVVRFEINRMYRDNMLARYSNLTLLYKRLIETAKKIGGHARINLYYADDTIVSGRTYERASSLMKSLYRSVGSELGSLSNAVDVKIFKGCFLLLNRLSEASTKGMLGEDCKRYFYFDIPISSIRNHEDFCFMCNLIRDARQLCIKSSTNEIAQRWKKVECRFRLREYYEYESDRYKRKRYQNRFYSAYWSSLELRRLGEGAEDTGQVCRMIVERLLLKHMGLDGNKEVGNDLDDSEKLEVLFSYVKVLSRPFFNYQWRNREAILYLILLFLEVLLNERLNSQYDYKEIISQSGYFEDKTKLLKLCSFIRKYRFVRNNSTIDDLALSHSMLIILVKQAMELNSNYIIRKNNIIRILEKNNEIATRLRKIKNKVSYMAGDDVYKDAVDSIQNFMSIYIRYVKQLTSLSGDEKKCVWLEKLLLTGSEYSSEIIDPSFIKAYGIGSELGKGLYIENTKALLDALKDIAGEIPEKIETMNCDAYIKGRLPEIINDEKRYYLNSFVEILTLNGFAKRCGDKAEPTEDAVSMLTNVIALYILLTRTRVNLNGPEAFYRDMMVRFAAILQSPMCQCLIITPEKEDVFCLLEVDGDKKNRGYILKEGGGIPALQVEDIESGENLLKTFCFVPAESKETDAYLVVKFESDMDGINHLQNNQDNSAEQIIIRPLYFIFDVRDKNREDVIKRLRFILAMRASVIKNIEQDFKNNSFQGMIEEKNKKMLLSVWKNATHSDDWIYSNILKTLHLYHTLDKGKQQERSEEHIKKMEGMVLRLLSDSNVSSKYHLSLTERLNRRYSVESDGIYAVTMPFEESLIAQYHSSLYVMPQKEPDNIVCKGIDIKGMEGRLMFYFVGEQEQTMLIIIPILQNALKYCAYGKKVKVFCEENVECLTKNGEVKSGLDYLCISNPLINPESDMVRRMENFIKYPVGMREQSRLGSQNGISLYAVNKFLEKLIETIYKQEMDFTTPPLRIKVKGKNMVVKIPILLGKGRMERRELDGKIYYT